MGLRPDDFDAMTPAEFIYAWLGWQQLEESRMRQAWERERWAVWVLTSIQLDRKDRRPMTQMFPLPWETAFAAEPVEQLSMAERLARVNRILKKNDDENNEIEYRADDVGRPTACLVFAASPDAAQSADGKHGGRPKRDSQGRTRHPPRIGNVHPNRRRVLSACYASGNRAGNEAGR
jgi:hypothetical protein